jgi:hypothetical protein
MGISALKTPIGLYSNAHEARPPTGDPDAGDPPVRFGGRSGANHCVVPTPVYNVSILQEPPVLPVLDDLEEVIFTVNQQLRILPVLRRLPCIEPEIDHVLFFSRCGQLRAITDPAIDKIAV